MSIVKGPVKWCSVQAPNTTFEPVWCVDVIVTPEQVAQLKKEGLKCKKDKDGDMIFKIKRNVTKADGTENNAPVVVDAGRKPLSKLVGNGSLCNVQYSVYDWKNKFGAGKSADFKAVQVLELVEYAAADGDEFEAADEASAELAGELDAATPVATEAPDAPAGGTFDEDDIPF